MTRGFGLAAVIFVAATTPAAAGFNLVNNGGFESLDASLSPPNYDLFAGGSSFHGWSVIGGRANNVLVINESYAEPGNGVAFFNADEGAQSLDLTGAGNTGLGSGIEQIVSTVAGQLYSLSFLVGRADPAPLYATASTVDLSLNGGERVSYTNALASANAVHWLRFNVSFKAVGSSTSIRFYNGTTTNNFAGLDDVKLESLDAAAVVPEPGTLGLVATGAVGLVGGWFRTRRRTAVA